MTVPCMINRGETVKVLVVEDDAEIVEFISLAFEVGWPGTEVICTHQGKEAIEFAKDQSPDIIIMDIGLPDINGFEVLKRIRRFSGVPVIIVTVQDTEADIVKGLEWGADEYVVKPFGQLELLARVKSTIRSRQYSSADKSLLIYGPFRFDISSGTLTYLSEKVNLTRTESMILNLLIKNPGHVVTYTELAETIWGDEYPHANDTLRVYIRRLRAKLQTNIQLAPIIQSRPGEGYLLEMPSQ